MCKFARRHSWTLLLAVACGGQIAVLGLPASAADDAAKAADPSRVLPVGKLPNDRRLEKLKDLNGYFPFAPSASPEQWQVRAERVRRQVLLSQGLWPMPTKTPANAVIHGKIERDGFTVEKVYLESFPGHFVTGNLYRPTGKSGRLPGVLCPHGHWPEGRFTDTGPKKIREQLAAGAERFELSGRYPLQARCAQLARMGCVVFHYDMVGYADSQQLPHRDVRAELDTPENWGFYGVQAELRMQNIMGLQTYNSVRSLDWLCELPEVDTSRIGVTGESGGGTQTILLSGIDPRVTVSMPAVMVSTSMQGGCTCENACYLRVDTGNVEFAALFAPKPQGLTAADDWTKELMTKGFPDLKAHYALLGAPDKIMAAPLTHFPHNYNYVSREAMYQWFNKYLNLGLEKPVVEEDFKPLSIAEMSVWDADHPRPASGPEYERSLLKTMTADAEKQLAALRPRDAASLAKYREVVGGAVDVLVGHGLPPAGSIEYDKITELDRGDYTEFKAFLRNKAHGEELPTIFLLPKKFNNTATIWVDAAGKRGLYDADGSLASPIRKLLDTGTAVAAADLLYQGEFLADGKPLAETPQVKGIKPYAGFTFGYNHAVFAERAKDVLTLISFCRNYDKHPSEKLYVVALGAAGPWAAAALARAGTVVDRAAIDTAGFRFAGVKSFADPAFWPGIVKYGDLPAVLALAAPTELWLAGEGSAAPPIVTAAYTAAGQAQKLTLDTGSESDKAASAVRWLTR